MKYIVDIDALKDCFDLLSKPVRYPDGNVLVSLNDIKEMIDKFPKEKYVDFKDVADALKEYASFTDKSCTNV